jgi:t-SNARE complex subunit (syntaxin)
MSKSNATTSEQKINKVIKMHDDDLRSLEKTMASNINSIDTKIAETRRLLAELNYDIPKVFKKP